jgi:hypothetical protein
MKYTSKTWIALLSWTLCVLTCHLHHLIAAGLMVIGHLLHLKACALAGRHLPHPMEKVVLPTSQTICAASIQHLRMTWMITA